MSVFVPKGVFVDYFSSQAEFDQAINDHLTTFISNLLVNSSD